MLTWISLVLNAVLVLFLVSAWLAVRLISKRKPPAWSLLAFLPLLIAVNLDYHPGEPFTPDIAAAKDPRKHELRKTAVREALAMVGTPMQSATNPDGVLCCDVAFRPWDRACGIGEMMIADYRSLDHPATRYPALYDDRRCNIRKNAKWIVDALSGTPKNTPVNPYFLRRINNLAAFLKSRGLYYRPGETEPRPGMLAFFQRPRDRAPTHVALIVEWTPDRRCAVQTSGSFDSDDDGVADLVTVLVPFSYITDRTELVGLGDLPLPKP